MKTFVKFIFVIMLISCSKQDEPPMQPQQSQTPHTDYSGQWLNHVYSPLPGTGGCATCGFFSSGGTCTIIQQGSQLTIQDFLTDFFSNDKVVILAGNTASFQWSEWPRKFTGTITFSSESSASIQGVVVLMSQNSQLCCKYDVEGWMSKQ